MTGCPSRARPSAGPRVAGLLGERLAGGAGVPGCASRARPSAAPSVAGLLAQRLAGGRMGSAGWGCDRRRALAAFPAGELSQILKYDQFGGSAPEKGTATAPSTGPIVARSLTSSFTG